jgi:hypothetical protein
MFMHHITRRLRGFARNEDGTIAMEAMIVLPVMFWAFLSMFSIFDAFRTYSINGKAAYTIGDSISRETAPIDQEYLTGALQMFEYLSKSQDKSSIRVSSLVYNESEDRFYRDWSKVSGTATELSDSDVSGWGTKLPSIPDNERIMVVETWSEYDPPFKTGLEEREIKNFVFTRPRFAPRVCWVECD